MPREPCFEAGPIPEKASKTTQKLCDGKTLQQNQKLTSNIPHRNRTKSKQNPNRTPQKPHKNPKNQQKPKESQRSCEAALPNRYLSISSATAVIPVTPVGIAAR